MNVRYTGLQDIPGLLEIFAAARRFMRSQGNMTQWPDTYPSEEVILQDIAKRQSYAIEHQGEVVGTFVLAIGPDPTYNIIRQGSWPNDNPYATIHRIASNGKVGSIADEALRFAVTRLKELNIPSLRIDTHADNRKMLEWIERSGFGYCGIIYIADGTPRRAYQLDITS